MPPFAGQGMNSGLRDAMNLGRKLDHVLRGAAGDAVLDTYEAERKSQVAGIVALSARLGAVIMPLAPVLGALPFSLADGTRRVGTCGSLQHCQPQQQRHSRRINFGLAPGGPLGIIGDGLPGHDPAALDITSVEAEPRLCRSLCRL